MALIQNEQEFEALFFVSEKTRDDGNLFAAINGYKDLLQYRIAVVNNEEQTNFTNYDAIIIERLGDLSWLFGWTGVADQLFSSLQLLSLESENNYLSFYLGIKRASLAVDLGSLETAFSLLQDLDSYLGNLESIPFHELDKWEENRRFPGINEEQNAILKTRIYFVLGGILMRLGQFEESILSFKQALKNTQDQKYKMVQSLVIPIRLGICRALLEKGDINGANKKLKEILPDLSKKISSGNYINWLELSAKYKMLTGSFGDAKKYFEEIINLCSKNNLVNAQIIALCNLSNINIFLNNISYAEELLRQARELAVQLDDETTLTRIQILFQLALRRSTSILPGVSILPSYSQSASNKSTTSLNSNGQGFDPVMDIKQSDFYLNFFEDKAIIFQQLLGSFAFQQAEMYLDDILEIFKNTDSIIIKNRLQFLYFLLMYYKGKKYFNGEEIEEIFELQSYFREQNLIPELWDLQRFFSWTENLKDESLRDLKQENYVLLRKMTESLKVTDQSIFLLNKWTAEEEILSIKTNHLIILANREKQGGLFMKLIHHWKVLITLDNLLLELESYKAFIAEKNFNKNNNWIQIEKRGWFKRVFFHPRDCLDIHFLILPDRAIIVYCGYMFLKYQVISLSRINIRAYVKCIHDLTFSFNKTRGEGSKNSIVEKKDLIQEITEVVTKVAEILNLPEMLSQVPSRIKRLSFIPDDALHGLPFAIIPYKEKYLIEHFAVSVNYKSKSFTPFFLRTKSVKSALLVGISYVGSNFNQLLGTSKEIEYIGELLKKDGFNIKRINDKNASKTNILSEAQDKKLLHIACHGIFNHENPDLSGLQLANGEILSLRDIWLNPRLSHITHISLSSCWAADNFILPNKLILSLPETFLRAGVDSVLGCFWEVSDHVSVKFMKKFYTYMKEYPRDIALQKTQLLALQNKLDVEKTDTSNLFYWAGFNLFGNSDKY